MGAPSQEKSLQWQRKQQILRKEGSLMRYKLGLSSEITKSIAASGKRKLVSRKPVLTWENHARNPQQRIIYSAATALNSPCTSSSKSGSSSDDCDDVIEVERSEQTTWLIPNFSPLKTNIGGTRCDPFQMFPVESKGHVPDAFDYCKLFSVTFQQG